MESSENKGFTPPAVPEKPQVCVALLVLAPAKVELNPGWLMCWIGVKHGDLGAEPPPRCSLEHGRLMPGQPLTEGAVRRFRGGGGTGAGGSRAVGATATSPRANTLAGSTWARWQTPSQNRLLCPRGRVTSAQLGQRDVLLQGGANTQV